MTLRYRDEEKSTLRPSTYFLFYYSGFDFCLLVTHIE